MARSVGIMIMMRVESEAKVIIWPQFLLLLCMYYGGMLGRVFPDLQVLHGRERRKLKTVFIPN